MMLNTMAVSGLMSIQDLLDILGQSFFGGNTYIAGIVIYMVALAIVFLLFARNNVMMGVMLSLPLTMIFSIMGILPTMMTLLLVVLAIIILANEYYKSQVNG